MYIIYLNAYWYAILHLIKKTDYVKFVYSEKATKFFEISTLLLTGTTWDKSKVEILQNFVAFSEYMNFNTEYLHFVSDKKTS